jgi:hypothetical protein
LKYGIWPKVDFFKAYDKVEWDYLFEYLKRLGILDAFTTKIMFIGTIAKVNINKFSKDFCIERGLWHGCPLAPYLFSVFGENVDATIKEKPWLGRLQGIKLPRSKN